MTDEIIYQEEEIQPRTTHHVQVRIYKSGGLSKDGRRGKIALEDKEAPPEVAKWLKSPECCRGSKQTLYGHVIDIWVDDKKVGDTSIEVPDADASTDEPPPPPPSPQGPIAIPAAADARYWRDMAAVLEAQYHKDKARYESEIEAYEGQLDEMAKRVLAAMEDSDKRIASKLAEEEKVIALANGRLEALHDELQRQSERRSASMDALDRDTRVFEDLREKMSEVDSKGTIETIVAISKDPEALQGLAGAAQVLVGLYQQIKGGGAAT